MSDDNTASTTNNVNPRSSNLRDRVDPQLLAELDAIYENMPRASATDAAPSTTGADAALYNRLRSAATSNEPNDPSGPLGLGAETVRELDLLAEDLRERYSGIINFDDQDRLDDLRERHDNVDMEDIGRPTENNSASLLDSLRERSGSSARSSRDRIANLFNAEIRALNEREGNGGNVAPTSDAALADATGAVGNPVDGTAANNNQGNTNTNEASNNTRSNPSNQPPRPSEFLNRRTEPSGLRSLLDDLRGRNGGNVANTTGAASAPFDNTASDSQNNSNSNAPPRSSNSNNEPRSNTTFNSRLDDLRIPIRLWEQMFDINLFHAMQTHNDVRRQDKLSCPLCMMQFKPVDGCVGIPVPGCPAADETNGEGDEGEGGSNGNTGEDDDDESSDELPSLASENSPSLDTELGSDGLPEVIDLVETQPGGRYYRPPPREAANNDVANNRGILPEVEVLTRSRDAQMAQLMGQMIDRITGRDVSGRTDTNEPNEYRNDNFNGLTGVSLEGTQPNSEEENRRSLSAPLPQSNYAVQDSSSVHFNDSGGNADSSRSLDRAEDFNTSQAQLFVSSTRSIDGGMHRWHDSQLNYVDELELIYRERSRAMATMAADAVNAAAIEEDVADDDIDSGVNGDVESSSSMPDSVTASENIDSVSLNGRRNAEEDVADHHEAIEGSEMELEFDAGDCSEVTTDEALEQAREYSRIDVIDQPDQIILSALDALPDAAINADSNEGATGREFPGHASPAGIESVEFPPLDNSDAATDDGSGSPPAPALQSRQDRHASDSRSDIQQEDELIYPSSMPDRVSRIRADDSSDDDSMPLINRRDVSDTSSNDSRSEVPSTDGSMPALVPRRYSSTSSDSDDTLPPLGRRSDSSSDGPTRPIGLARLRGSLRAIDPPALPEFRFRRTMEEVYNSRPPTRFSGASRFGNEGRNRNSVKQLRDYGAIKVFASATCPICLDECDTVVALKCGHCLCEEDYRQLGGYLASEKDKLLAEAEARANNEANGAKARANNEANGNEELD
ncbi:hypothetical protein ACHAXN_003730 [Cyclotella atomus]